MTDDDLDQLRLASTIETARARQREGEARTAEAVERARQRDHAERAEQRAAAAHQRRLDGFLTPRALSADVGELLVVNAVTDADGGVR